MAERENVTEELKANNQLEWVSRLNNIKNREEETKRYFETAYDFVAEYENLGEEYIMSAKVHLDEEIPHIHLKFL